MKLPAALSANNYRPLFLAAVFVIVLESLLKGWFSFFVAPLLVLVVPTLVLCRLVARKQAAKGTIHPWVMPLVWAQLISILLFYVCLPGFGDTEDILLFGFLVYNVDNPIVIAAQWVAYFAFMAAIICTVAVIILLIIRKQHDPRQE